MSKTQFFFCSERSTFYQFFIYFFHVSYLAVFSWFWNVCFRAAPNRALFYWSVQLWFIFCWCTSRTSIFYLSSTVKTWLYHSIILGIKWLFTIVVYLIDLLSHPTTFRKIRHFGCGFCLGNTNKTLHGEAEEAKKKKNFFFIFPQRFLCDFDKKCYFVEFRSICSKNPFWRLVPLEKMI